MSIHINEETERLIRSALASGEFATAEEFVAAMASHWKTQHHQAKPSALKVPSAFEAFSQLGVIGCMRPDASDLATNPNHMQGFGR